MKGIKSFDFFQKIAVDNVTQPTIIGSALSVSAISLIFFLLLREVIDFLTPSIKRETMVYHDPDQNSKIKVNLILSYPNVPCHILSVDQEDSIGNHRMDISDTLTKRRNSKTSQLGMELDRGNRGYIEVETVVKAVSEGEGCVIQGFVPISKVPGDIHISHHNYADLFNYLRSERRDLFTKTSLNHKLINLYFGDMEINSDKLHRFGYDDKTNGFNRLNDLPNYEKPFERKNYDYFIKLIPHVFEDKIRGETFTAYQYSMTTRSRDYDTESQEMPIIIFHYDLSPITMKVTLSGKSFAHSLTHICAIVGGVYVIFSILNRLVLAFCDFNSSSEKKGVAASG
jgi:hypothetical protein